MENTDLVCIPGQRLCLADKEHISGCGTYERNGYIYSTLAGVVNVVKEEKVTIVNQRFCKCVIKCISDTVLTRPYRAVLRKEDVRATEKDRVEMIKCFRPGDIILARVLPMTEVHTYQLTTAENELGVVIAHSESGAAMVPISWTEMQCPKTYVKEPRKVAKVVPENVNVDSS
ncbi:exosome complex component CSL4 isoform X2 [Periplaneta americana]|uniref:exosome complex component CSL4 isoform X2 n=1 Tax=Periplaneta americana TaxID=6978 RepID=UPI0037E94A40